MRTCALSLFLVFLMGGCGKNDLSKNEQPSQTAAVADVEDIRMIVLVEFFTSSRSGIEVARSVI